MIKPFKISAVKKEGEYRHFGIFPATAGIYGDDPKDIITVVVSISPDQSIPTEVQNEADYWGWYDKDEKETSMIYQSRFQLNMCFPSGIEHNENLGKGKAYRLNIKRWLKDPE